MPVPSDWKQLVQPYTRPSTARSVAQVVTTLAGLAATEAAAVWAWTVSPLLALPLVVVAAGFLVRTFVLQHDCGHGSFLRHERLQDAIGALLGLVMMTPYEAWRSNHAAHHATTGDLDRRGLGDIDMLTVDEYRRLSPGGRLRYRLFRTPLVLFVFGPPLHFFFRQRFAATFGADLDARARRSVRVTNVGALVVLALIVLLGGWQALLLVHAPAMTIACGVGVFLFYAQHQVEAPSWERRADWSFAAASLEGSSYLKLPRLLRYFTADIGVHHLHHLAPRIPNYRLQQCADENPTLLPRTTFGVRGALATTRLKLYDERTGRMVGFAAARDDVIALAPAAPSTAPRRAAA